MALNNTSLYAEKVSSMTKIRFCVAVSVEATKKPLPCIAVIIPFCRKCLKALTTVSRARPLAILTSLMEGSLEPLGKYPPSIDSIIERLTCSYFGVPDTCSMLTEFLKKVR